MTTMRKTHQAADALDWNEAMVLVQKLYDDGMVRDSLLVESGCFLGLRVSDLLHLRWEDLLSDEFVINEQKTGKTRTLRVSSSLMKHAKRCRKDLENPSLDSYVFVRAGGDRPISRQAVDLMMKKVKVK